MAEPGALSPARVTRRREVRERMLGRVAASYALDALVLLLYAESGTTTLRVPMLYALAGGLACATFFIIFRQGIGARASDPFLSLEQNLVAVAIQVALLAIAPEVGFVFLTIL